jgi:hypothetical protein
MDHEFKFVRSEPVYQTGRTLNVVLAATALLITAALWWFVLTH